MWVQIAERASTGEQQQKRVKWNILQYHQGSPFVWSLLLYLLSQDPHNYSMCSPERVCTCKCRHARTSTCIHRANQRRNKIQKRREETRFGMSLSVFYSYIILFCVPPSMAGNRETWATIRLWCDTLLRPLFCTTPANMQAHLSKALKPSLILWRPKHLHFFQQTSSQLALDCQWGSPNSKIYHLETHKSPLRQIFPFKASQKKKKGGGGKKRRGRKNSEQKCLTPCPPFLSFFSLPLWHTRKKTDINNLRYNTAIFLNEEQNNPCAHTHHSCSQNWKSGPPLNDFIKNRGNFNHLSIQSQLDKSYLRDLHKYKPSKTFHLQRGFQDPIGFVL